MVRYEYDEKSNTPADRLGHLILPGEEGGALFKHVCTILFWLYDYFLLDHTMAG